MENKNPRPPCFLIVLDTAMSAEELQDAKDSLGQLVALLPEECLVGLITFGATVTVHELCDGNAFPKSYVLRGTDDVTQDQLKKLLTWSSPRPSTPLTISRGAAPSRRRRTRCDASSCRCRSASSRFRRRWTS